MINGPRVCAPKKEPKTVLPRSLKRPNISLLPTTARKAFTSNPDMAWIFILYSVLAAYAIWTVTSLLVNYYSARRIGLPIVISPVSPLDPFWIFSHRYLPLKLLRSLPWGLGTFARCSYMGWSFQDKCAIHQEMGGAFVLVNPGINEVIVADPEAVHSILGRRKEFIKPAALYGKSKYLMIRCNQD